jgi:hypothetical protein
MTKLFEYLVTKTGSNFFKYLYWGILFLPQPFLFFIGRALSPFACLFIVRKPRTDVVKRLGKRVVTLDRDDLQDWLSWFRTDDNAADEHWYGMYGDPNTTQEEYDSQPILRWYCRMLWYQRNNLYTFNRKYFGLSKDSPLAWQYKGPSFIKGRTINIGFKAHKGIDRLMFAGRVF